MAADIYKFLVIIAGLTILFNLAGIPTGAGLLLGEAGIDLQGNPQDINLTTLAIIIGAAIAVASGVGLAIGFFTKSSPVIFLLVGYATLLLVFVGDIVIISTFAFANYSAWIGWIVLLIMIPLGIGYLHSIISWWAGRN